MKKNVIVFGSGNFGTSLAFHLATLEQESSEHSFRIYARDKATIESINNKHINSKYLPNTVLPNNLVAVGTEFLEQCLATVDTTSSDDRLNVIIMCIPTQHLAGVLKQFKPLFVTPVAPDRLPLLIMANKGIETSTLHLPIDILEQVCGKEVASRAVFFSGPSFAAEIVERQPTCVTVASENVDAAIECQKLFHAPYFRVYTSNDPIGVEIAGALKNVVAIASGICSGLGYQMNTRSALITRGLAEIARIGRAMGCKDDRTFAGLSGVGDLFLTCTSEKSRNFTVGYRMGKYGESLQEVIDHLGSVAEGVPTTKAAFELCNKLQVSSPIIETVHAILYENKPIPAAVTDLLRVEMQAEFTY